MWFDRKCDPLCQRCRAKVRRKGCTSLRAYLEGALADSRVSDATKQDIRDWMDQNPFAVRGQQK